MITELDKEIKLTDMVNKYDIEKITLEILTAFSFDQTLIKMMQKNISGDRQQ